MADEKVNVGTAERPIFVPKSQVVAEDSSFWRGVVSGSVLVRGAGSVLVRESGGIDLDKALKIGGAGREKNAQSNRSR